jgi:antitoxin VapB
LWERTADIRAEIASWPATGLKADKAFFDELSGEDER